MPLEEQFIKRNGELQQKVKEEIEKVKEGQSERNIVQLQTILSELQTSSRQKNIILSYPRIIIDSWDYSDYLGMELVELEELVLVGLECLFPLPLYSYAISLQLPVSPVSYLERLQESVGLVGLVELEPLVPSHRP